MARKKDHKDPIQGSKHVLRSQHPGLLQVRRSGGRRRCGSACGGHGCMHASNAVRGAFVRRLPACVTSDVVFTARYAHPDMFCSQSHRLALEPLPVASFVVRRTYTLADLEVDFALLRFTPICRIHARCHAAPPATLCLASLSVCFNLSAGCRPCLVHRHTLTSTQPSL